MHELGQLDASETHISYLFFTPDRVLKILKPVDTSFLSFVDRADRLAAAEKEFRLNHRISPEVYQGLADVVEGGGDGSEGEVTERIICMARLPAERALDRLVGRPDFDENVTDTARFVAAFHSRQEPIFGDEAAPASIGALRANWADNWTNLEPLVGSVVSPVDFQRCVELVERYLEGRSELFAERVADGRVIDGHGDLRAEHVFCLDDGPQVIDCLAFRDDFRIGDMLNDVAFLAMDLHRLAGPEAAKRLLRSYDEFTGEHHPGTLAHHYVAYRAHVRAKVAAIRHAQGDALAAAEVAEYHSLALEHLERGQVRMVLVGGGSGTGKSTVSEGLAERLGAIWLRTDEARQTAAIDVGGDTFGGEMDGDVDGDVVGQPGEGRYRLERTSAVYRELLREAEELLTRGESVVLDASWFSGERRSWARQVAERCAASLTELRCELPLAVAQQRIVARLARSGDPSESTPEIAAFLDAAFEPWPEASTVDTSGEVEAALVAAEAAVIRLPTPRR